MRKQTKKQQRALRSAAALKGWETRRRKNLPDIDWTVVWNSVPVFAKNPDPNPWPGLAAWLKGKLARVFG